jgi:hypothetical protein
LKHLFQPVFQVQRTYLGQIQLQLSSQPEVMIKIGDLSPFTCRIKLPIYFPEL